MKSLVSLIAMLLASGVALASSEVPHSVQKEEFVAITIAIKARQFQPSTLTLPVGREVRLIFENQDAELHAFVPETFLEGVPLHVEGDGSPQFGEHGLIRVLIPSGGREHIRFTPAQPGQYRYRCDLPGHQMVGHIVVEERTTDQPL